MVRSEFYILGVLAVLLMLHSDTSACSCNSIDGSRGESQLVRRARKSAEAVFTGKVIAIREFGTEDLEIRFQVDRVWKGEVSVEAVVLTPSDKDHCNFGFPFREGERYLVYSGKAYTSLTTSICTRTTKFDEALLDLKVLGKGKPPKVKINRE